MVRNGIVRKVSGKAASQHFGMFSAFRPYRIGSYTNHAEAYFIAKGADSLDLEQLVSATLGISAPWQVRNVSLTENGRRLDVIIQCVTDKGSPCPCCGARGDSCGAVDEVWFHKNFLRYATYLHTRTPQLACCSGRRLPNLPWVRPGSLFVKLETGGSDEYLY